MKRVVRLKDKATGEIRTYPSLVAMRKENGDIGICANALYNALNKGQGLWENKKYMVYWENIDLGREVWD
jgi:hypothetical protein